MIRIWRHTFIGRDPASRWKPTIIHEAHRLTSAADGIERLVASGLVKRWMCERCQDWILYRTHEMSEAESKANHERIRHQRVGNGTA